MNTERLLDNITEQIKEIQLKLGFAPEMIRLFYPASSLASLLQVQCDNAEEVLAFLKKENFADCELGKMRFSLCRDHRIEVCIPPEGAVYVHENVPDPPFLKRLIELFRENHHLTIEEIGACFAQYNPDYICRKTDPGTDFDYVLYFPEGKPDAWYYCVRMEMGHTIYHRFAKKDYERLLQ